MTGTELIEGHRSDPQRIAVGLSAVLADRWGADLLKAPVDTIAEKFREEFSREEENEMLDTLARGFGNVTLERCILASKISIVKLLEACETGDQLTIRQVAKRLGLKEDAILAEALNPAGQKLSNVMLLAHIDHRPDGSTQSPCTPRSGEAWDRATSLVGSG